MEEIKEMCDIAIFDGTPSLLVTDATILSRIVDSTLIVTSYNSTKMENVEKVKKNIEIVGAKVTGVTINKIPISGKKYVEKYYYASSNIPVAKRENIKKETENEDKTTKVENIDEEIVDKILNKETITQRINEDIQINNENQTSKRTENEENDLEIAEEIKPKKVTTRRKSKEDSDTKDKETKKRTVKKKDENNLDDEKKTKGKTTTKEE